MVRVKGMGCFTEGNLGKISAVLSTDMVFVEENCMGVLSELGTPELTEIFCINDECTYGDIPGLEFIRHTTLEKGGDKCDFYIRVVK